MNAAIFPSLDARTLLFALSIFGFLMAAIAMSSASAMPAHKPALVEWSKAMAAAGGAFVCYFMRGYAPWFFTFLMANALIMMSAVYGHFAFARLLEKPLQRTSVIVITALALAGVLATYAELAPMRAAVFTISSGISAVLGLTTWMLFRSLNEHDQRTPPSIIATCVTGLMSTAFAIRAATSVLGDATTVRPEASSVTQVSALLTGVLYIVATSAGFLAKVHERQRQATLDSVRRDGLTGVYTRSAFFEFASALAQNTQTRRYAIVMIDIDHFKQVNDTFGHTGGDVALAHAARLISGAVRISDIVGRYGGEEFCILLRDCGETEAGDLARRLVREASSQRVRLNDGRTIAYTLSAGYAAHTQALPQNESPQTLGCVIERADQALYQAKHQGRNRAVGAHIDGLGTPLISQ